MPWWSLRISTHILHEEKLDIARRAGADGKGDETGAIGDFRQHFLGNNLDLHREGARVFQPFEVPIELEGFFSGLSDGPKATCPCAVTRDKTKVPHDRHVHLREHRDHTQTAQRINRVRPVLHRLEGRIDNGRFASIVRQHQGGMEKRLRCALADLGGEGALGRDDVDFSFGCRCSLIGSRCGHLGELALALRGPEIGDRQIATGRFPTVCVNPPHPTPTSSR